MLFIFAIPFAALIMHAMFPLLAISFYLRLTETVKLWHSERKEKKENGIQNNIVKQAQP